MQNGSAHFSLTKLSQLYSRAQLVDYLVYSDVYPFIFVGSLPKEGDPFKSLYLPFDGITWMFLVGSGLICAIVLHLIEWCWKRVTNGTDPLKYDGDYIVG